jgi:hypothetical protein
MLCEFLFSLIFGYLGYKSYVDDEYKTCRVPLGVYHGFLLWLIGLMVLSSGFGERCMFFRSLICITSFFLFFILELGGIPLLIWNAISTFNCMSIQYTIITWAIPIFINSSIFLLIFTLIQARNNHIDLKENLQEEIDGIYQKILTEDFDVEKFIETYSEEVINSFELTEEELKIIKDKFSACITQD